MFTREMFPILYKEHADLLNNNEKIAFEGVYYEHKTLEQIGNELGVGRERARMIFEKGRRKLAREHSRLESEKEFAIKVKERGWV